MNHYERLGVPADASHEQIRAAYRALARRTHPDLAHGAADSMAEINRAWHVLGDPQRRGEYDRQTGVGYGPSSSGDATDRPGRAASESAAAPLAPLPAARIPWRLFIGLAVSGAFAVVVAHALTKPAEPAPIDNLLRPGDCATIEINQDAREVPCDEAARWTVVRLVPFTSTCPTGTEAHRDRQGMGTACLQPR